MRRPLFWMGITFLSSTAVFLRFSPMSAALFCVAATLLALLFSNATPLNGVALFTACAVAGAAWCSLYGAAMSRYLAPVISAENQPADIVMTVIKKDQSGVYCRWSGRSTVTVNGVSRTFAATLSGYTEQETAVGEVLHCTAKLKLPIANSELRYQLTEFLEPPKNSPHPITELRTHWQQALSKRAAALSKDSRISGVLSALLTGDRTRLSSDIISDFRGSGLSHILVVSGLHLILVSRLVSILLSRFCSNRCANLISVLFCWLFALVSGMGSSVIRAAVMLTLVHLAGAAKRHSDTLTSLIVAAVLMALADPNILLTASFLLSFGAVAGLATVEKPVLKFLRGEKAHGNVTVDHFLQNFSVGIAAQVGAAPVLICFFGTVPLLGVIANLAAIWLIEPIMLLGLTALSCSFLSSTLACVIAMPCNALIGLLLFVAQLFSRLPFAQIGFTERWQTLWLVGSVFLLILILSKRPRTPIGRFAALGCVAFGLTACVLSTAMYNGTAEIILFKSSNSAAIVRGSHAVLLGAPQNGFQLSEMQNALDRMGVESLDAVILDSPSQATYHTAALLQDHPNAVLCCPATRTSVTFSHSAGIALKYLPDDSVLFDTIRYQKSGDETIVSFSNAKLLKSAGSCVIIGKYAEPKPFSDTVLRARVAS